MRLLKTFLVEHKEHLLYAVNNMTADDMAADVQAM